MKSSANTYSLTFFSEKGRLSALDKARLRLARRSKGTAEGQGPTKPVPRPAVQKDSCDESALKSIIDSDEPASAVTFVHVEGNKAGGSSSREGNYTRLALTVFYRI